MRVASLFVSILLFLGCGCPKFTQSEPIKIPPVYNLPVSVFQENSSEDTDLRDILAATVTLKNEGFKGSMPKCAGVVIASEPRKFTLVLTACHCVIDRKTQLPQEFLFIDTGNDGLYRVEVLDYDRAEDLAILIATDLTPRLAVATISSVPPKIGDAIWMVGAGGGIEDNLSRGIVSKVSAPSPLGYNGMLVDCTGWYGNSGGGIYDEDLNLIGILSAFGPQFDMRRGPSTGWMWAANWYSITKFLTKVNSLF